ncbi:MAG TPA: serine/threonine-protein kinase [Gemmatimonadaceae bacterium]
MGTVYLAERDDVSKRVALKVVRGALGAPDLVPRFLVERRVLARLEHPGIARLLDAGMTDDGTPWLAMEYVDGVPLTEWCDTRGLGVRERLRLFVAVCDAVAYAHANLVVHRDLKPSNVLVDATGQVKLLDFGIAKLLSGASDDADATRTGTRLLSPDYAAPEQLTGARITTATDVHALGVLLFELLTGELPFRREGTAGIAAMQAVIDTEPPRPSTVARRDAVANRGLPGWQVSAPAPYRSDGCWPPPGVDHRGVGRRAVAGAARARGAGRVGRGDAVPRHAVRVERSHREPRAGRARA